MHAIVFFFLFAAAALGAAMDAELRAAHVFQQTNRTFSRREVVSAFAGGVSTEAQLDVLEQRYGDAVHAWHRQGGPSTMSAAPEQLHISVTDAIGNITVMWTTSTQSQHSQVCWWAVQNGMGVLCANGTAYTYSPVTIVPWSGTLHEAHMVSLTPGATYQYKVGDPVVDVWSNVTTFTAPDLEKDSIVVALGGDMGSYQLNGYLVAAQMFADDATLKFDAFWHLGDIAYSTLDPPKLNVESLWDTYMEQEAPLVNHVPLLVTMGNHDFAGGDSAAFINRFRNPTIGGGLDNFYWSYRHGPVMYVSMCTEQALEHVRCNYTQGSPQYAWLDATLGAVDRSVTPWVVVAGHRPMYSSDKSTDSGPLQAYLEPMFIRHGVDVALYGHMHCAEIVAPVNNGVPQPGVVTVTGVNKWAFTNATTSHLTVGTLGAVIIESFQNPPPAWSLYRAGNILDNDYGYAVLRANRTSMNFQFMSQSTGAVTWEVQYFK